MGKNRIGLHRQKVWWAVWLAGFGAGIFMSGLQSMAAEKESMLFVEFYNDKGQKVCVRQDAVLELSEKLKIELPMESWEDGEEGTLELILHKGDGTKQKRCLTVAKKPKMR